MYDIFPKKRGAGAGMAGWKGGTTHWCEVQWDAVIVCWGEGGQAIGMQRINRQVHPRLQCNRDRESRVDGQQSLREALVRQQAYQSPIH